MPAASKTQQTLALGLRDHGHYVTLLAHENFKTFVEDYGIRFHPLPGNVEAMLYTPRGLRVLKTPIHARL